MRLALLLALAASFAACQSHAGHTTAPAGTAYADDMHREHAGEAPTATPATNAASDTPVTAERVVYATLDGQAVTGVLAYPAASAGPTPGLVVIHEWWGLNENIEAMARRYAAEGYTVLAVDLYEGAAAANADEARQLMQTAMGRAPRLVENLRQATAYLRSERNAPRVGVLGWCFGGAWTLRAALAMPDDVDAAVIYYGQVETDRAALAPLGQTPVLGLFGGADRSIPVEGVRAFEAALQANGTPSDVVVYDGADHAFANPSGQRYDAVAAEDAWARTTAFLAQHLGQAPR